MSFFSILYNSIRVILYFEFNNLKLSVAFGNTEPIILQEINLNVYCVVYLVLLSNYRGNYGRVLSYTKFAFHNIYDSIFYL